MTPLQILPKNVRDFGKLVVAKGFKNLPKVQKIAQSGRTDWEEHNTQSFAVFRGAKRFAVLAP